MDQAQKDKIDSLAVEISEKLEAQDFARKLQMMKLVTINDIEDIMTKFSGNFSRNMKLLHAARESECESAYSDLVYVLDELELSCARDLQIDRSTRAKKPSGVKNILSSIRDTFKSKNQYPLGLNSGLSNSSASCSPLVASNATQVSYQNETTSTASPFRGKHQIASNNDESSDHSRHLGNYDFKDLRISKPNSEGNVSIGHGSPVGRLQTMTHQSSDRFSQTPSRPFNMAFSRNLSICESELQESPTSRAGGLQQGQFQQGCEEEPMISWHPYAQSPSLENQPRAGSPHQCHPCYSSASSESGESSSDSLIVDPNHILDPNVMTAITREGPSMMSVKHATLCHNNPQEDYKMTARPRGNCLIVNNINFEDEIFPTRKGSDEDANRFDQIFRQLGFDTIMTRNLTADQMRAKFQELSAACKPEHDALFVFILSHGSEHGIYGTDGMEVYLESEIISCFDNRNCKSMIGKPKVFVIQACRGRSKDCGGDGDTTDSIAWAPVAASPAIRSLSQENRVPSSWLPSNQPSDGKKRKHPIRTDMLLVFSCLAGFVSVRNETAGSWLGVALAYFIMTHAHESDLEGILKLVTNDIIQRESSHGHIQSVETKLLGWTKRLYFNPGIYS